MISKHPKIKDSSTIGIPHPLFGEEIVSFVIKNGDLDKKELINFCSKRLQQYKCPKEIIFIDYFPQTSSGKPLRRRLREMYQERKTS